jgi:hypothetical protein
MNMANRFIDPHGEMMTDGPATDSAPIGNGRQRLSSAAIAERTTRAVVLPDHGQVPNHHEAPPAHVIDLKNRFT